MAKKKKKRAATPDADDVPASAPPAPAIGTAFSALLTRAGLSKIEEPKPKPGRASSAGTGASTASAKPSAATPGKARNPPPPMRPAVEHGLGPGELSALNAAYRGVQPIKRKPSGRVRNAAQPSPQAVAVDPEERAARERLSALVGGGVRFDVQWDDGFVQGVRRGVAEKQLRRLSGAGFAPEATLDLHGMRREQAVRSVHDFIAEQKRRGARYLLVIVGKGLHSEDGRGVLAEALVQALTEGFSAPRVAAFASAAERHGGRGAIAIELG